ncbi:hypothetical protein [Mycoplasmoides pneumoniae]|uniref:hypothetical protein n=1 Tax=Mycoplasmoides pneumoniae TaxID=2104 RepID=UPI0006A755F5|nr:hypothetical protein [Mycoplasmoides pneumoniae]ALA36337.1 hypothetical protein F538_00660 [Mycoplasmoides pneumoniae M1139]ALA38454.1 hypothetical protein F529_00665 [Mycoplasmoides pneumoniae MAC]
MDYTQLVIIHVLYALSTVLTFWSAFIKSIKLLGPADEQARLYSTSEGSRYLIQVITGYISAGLGAIVLISTPFLIYKAPTAADPKNLASSSGIFFALLFYAICYVLAGLLSLFFYQESSGKSARFTWKMNELNTLTLWTRLITSLNRKQN